MYQALLLSALRELTHLLSQNSIRYVLLLFLFYKQENQGSQQLNNLRKFTQLTKGGTKI